MKKTLSIFFIAAIVALGLSGCSQNRAYKTWEKNPIIDDTINETIISLSNKLLQTSKIKSDGKLTVTSFVDLHQLNKTTHFGRKLAESFFAELHYRGFKVVDARGSDTIRINAEGEFLITRDIELLKNKKIENSYVLVGTYTKFGDGIMINARIIDNKSGEIMSAARTIVDVNDCDIYENCKSTVKNIKPSIATINIPESKRMIGISDAGCSYVNCPENCVDSACYNYIKKPMEKPTITTDKKEEKTCPKCEIGAK